MGQGGTFLNSPYVPFCHTPFFQT